MPLSWRVTKHEASDYYTEVKFGTNDFLAASNFDRDSRNASWMNKGQKLVGCRQHVGRAKQHRQAGVSTTGDDSGEPHTTSGRSAAHEREHGECSLTAGMLSSVR
jgi:hypothetical protein